jgi:cell division protein FtsW (lipid II flippase)
MSAAHGPPPDLGSLGWVGVLILLVVWFCVFNWRVILRLAVVLFITLTICGAVLLLAELHRFAR